MHKEQEEESEHKDNNPFHFIHCHSDARYACCANYMRHVHYLTSGANMNAFYVESIKHNMES